MESQAQAGCPGKQSEKSPQEDPADIEESLLEAMRRWEAATREGRESEKQRNAWRFPN